MSEHQRSIHSNQTIESQQTPFDFAIVGGGIIGKACALGLAQIGYTVTQISPDFNKPLLSINQFGQRIYALSPSSKNLLTELHIWESLDHSRIQAVRDMRIYGDRGEKNDQLHFSAFEAGRPELAWIIESDLIESTLTQAIRFNKNIFSIESDVDQISIESNQLPALRLNDGQTIQSKLIIAADGAKSPLRSSVGIAADEYPYDQMAVVANFSCSTPHLETAYQWFLPNGDILAMLPLPQQHVSMVWSTQIAHAKHLVDLDPPSWNQYFNSEVHQKLGNLQLQSQPASFPLKQIKAHRLIGPEYDPKAILVGDAAHVMHPLAGQGLNLGLRDVSSFLEIMKTKEAFRSIDDRTLLRRYERARVADTRSLLWLTDRLKKLFSANNSIEKQVRNWGLGLINRSHIIKRQLIERALGDQ